MKPHRYYRNIELADDGTALVRDNLEEKGTYYKITREEVRGNGVILLGLTPILEAEKLIEETAEALTKQLDIGEPNFVKKIVKDALAESSLEKLESIHNKVTKEKVPIKVHKGCLELTIGKGRRWDNTIRIR